jgi:GT2 family glycosyltransferase
MTSPIVVRNDWSSLLVPALGQWRPTLSVSVVIPAYRCQSSLDLTLASLARQTYPGGLLEVVVVDDGSDPPLELPKLRPEHCRLVRPVRGWGRANALHTGAGHSNGDIIHWLDADMVVYPTHVEAQARWHHQVPYAVTLGGKRFVDVSPDRPGWPSPDEVADACAADDADRLFAGRPTAPHGYVERLIAETDQLRAADHLGFMAHVGATAALRREMYEATGGLDTNLRLAEDTEFGYRLAQSGAVFVPEPQARSWHLGTSHMMRHEKELQRYNWPFLAELMPQPRWLRRVGGSGWAVPLVTVVMTVDSQPLERVRAAVDAVLHGDETDLRVLLVGPWHALSVERTSPLADPQLDLRLVATTYRSDPRVRLVEQAPSTVYPSPFLLTVPVACGLGRLAVRRLVDYADRHRLGLVRVEVGPETTVDLWRTAACGRARWTRREGESLAGAVSAVHGAGTVSAELIGVADLAGLTPAQLAAAGPPARDLPMGRWVSNSVEVAGARTLARAASLVARLAVLRTRDKLRRLLRKRPLRKRLLGNKP